jgi:hypothetical protein
MAFRTGKGATMLRLQRGGIKRLRRQPCEFVSDHAAFFAAFV